MGHARAFQEAMESLEGAYAPLNALRYEIRKAYETDAPAGVLAGLLRRSAELSLLKARKEATAAALAEALAGEVATGRIAAAVSKARRSQMSAGGSASDAGDGRLLGPPEVGGAL